MSTMDSDASEPKIVDFGPPFDDEDADLILRSSDNSNFRVYSVVICKCSAVLKEKVRNTMHEVSDKAKERDGNAKDTDGTPASDSVSLPVVAFPADSETLHSLLSTILPVPLHLPDSFEKIAPILSLAGKCGMSTSITLIQKIVLADSPGVFHAMDPLRAYFIACRYSLVHVARSAAQRTLPQPIEKCVGDDLRFVSASALNALWRYRSTRNPYTLESSLAFTTKPFAAPRAYGPPFDRSDADIILRSSDGVEFSVYKTMLSMASPVFESMFTLPRSNDSDGCRYDSNSVPIVDMSEDSRTLFILFSTIFPIPAVSKASIDEVFPALAAAQKYEMEGASSWMRVLLCQGGDPITLSNAVRAYGLASEHRLRNEGVTAARLTLRGPMTFEAINKDLPTISGRALCALWKYRKAYSQAAQACIQDAYKPTRRLHSMCTTGYCSEPVDREKNMLPSWCHEFFVAYAARFSDTSQPLPYLPNLATDLHDAVPKEHLLRCSSCKTFDIAKIGLVAMTLSKKIETATENVSLDFDEW